MDKKFRVLLVFDNPAKCDVLWDILKDDYYLDRVDNYEAAQIAIEKSQERVALIILGLEAQKNAKRDFVSCILSCRTLHNIPVVLSVDDKSDKEEINQCLGDGAWDYLKEPHDPGMVRFRINNIINANEASIYRELKYREMFDSLTGIYNRGKFYEEARKIIDDNPKMDFAFIRFDIYKFQLINQFYGMEEGDRLIKFVADDIAKDMVFVQEKYGTDGKRVMAYGRIEKDVFCCLVPYDNKETILANFNSIRERIDNYGLDFVILPVFGVYIIEDRSLSINDMYDRANMASKKCKGNYLENYAFYDEQMSKVLVDEQMIVNEMSNALDCGQFILYLQPKYEIKNNQLVGAEALVRWLHPEKGLISPGVFIPIFEQNGFILQLDCYVWESTCKLIRKWLDEGKKPDPVSVNMSRISLYNPKLVDIICGLVKKYDIPPYLLELELTESAFTSNPIVIRDTMRRLQENGFTVLMDDFGSGYSSLNALKDMSLDVLKMDMRFLSKTDNPERSKCIMASIVRMAKWLKMTVTAEGVETKEQLDFLKSIGCECIQGYYFAKPMPIEEYEEKAFKEMPYHREHEVRILNAESRSIYAYNEQMDALFANLFQPVAIYEYCNGEIEVIRANGAYYDLFGHNDLNVKVTDGWFNGSIEEMHRQRILNAFEEAATSKDSSYCEYARSVEDGTSKWVHADYKYVGSVEDKVIIFATIMDITAQKKVYAQLANYRKDVFPGESKDKSVLVVDDEAINRQLIKKILGNKYSILEAEDGVDAMRVLKNNKVDMILLDLVMPNMNGVDLLKSLKSRVEYKDIPVVVVSADNDPESQIELMELGCSDYIIKPLIPEVVKARIDNAFISSRADAFRKGQEVDEYSSQAVDNMIEDMLGRSSISRALMLVDVDNFNEINRKFGRIEGDRAIKAFGEELNKYFRKCDVVERYDGDEFVVFVSDMPSKEDLVRRCDNLIKSIDVVTESGVKLECSIGIAYTCAATTFSELMEKADRALYIAKNRGKNQCVLYQD
ncbi:MAG: EAL domain-containing protein [Lachnospira sp.]|nr:EAL domain-containing protein [Lachnospira sp.]